MADGSLRKLYFVVGEPSGDALGAAVLQALNADGDAKFDPVGLGGTALRAEGLQSLFEIDHLSVMGFGPVIARLPDLMRRVGLVVNDIVAKRPEAVLLIDSPEFCTQVAKRVRKRLPNIPIVKYVCPSIWAWRPGRALKMARYIDHVLCLLPFEPAALERLGGPTGTYVGHPLVTSMAQWHNRATNALPDADGSIQALLLPGSRKAEIARSLPVFLVVAQHLASRHNMSFVLPTLDRREAQVRDLLATSSLPVEVIVGDDARREAVARAHVAMATSGTISLELGLGRVPHAIYYEASGLEKLASRFITTWSVNLPNLILDEPVVPECVGDAAKAERLLREIDALAHPGPARDRHAQGYERLWQATATDIPPAELAAQALRRAAKL
ncbi:MAG: lipid-A-disaccharide synthase [Pseudomonadota bacterium]